MKKHYAVILIILSTLFVVSYVVIFYLFQGMIASQFDSSAPDLLGLRNFAMLQGGETQEMFAAWGGLAGVGFGLFTLLLAIILWGVTGILRIGHSIMTKVIIAFVSFSLPVLFGAELLFWEERTTVLVRSIIFYVGFPLFYASLLTMAVLFIIGIISLMHKHPETKKMILLFAIILPVLSGCKLLSDLTSMTCSIGLDETHCNQEAAISGNDETKCDKVKAPQEYKDVGSNPPQDKCYMIVAENKKDPTICEKIKGGFGSYEKGDCVQEIAVGTQNYDLCTKGATSMEVCTQKIVDVEQQVITSLLEQTKNEPAPDPKKLQEVGAMLDRMSKMYQLMTSLQKQTYDMSMSATRNLR